MLKRLVLIACIVNLPFSSVFSQKVGLVLSGGGAKGAVHIGVIKALEDNEIPIDYIGGTSAGAIVGSLYAMGYSPKEILDLFMSEDFRYWQSGKVDENYSYYFRKPESTPAFMDFTVSIKDSSGFKAELPTNFINPIQMNQAFMGLYSQATARSKGDFNNLFVPFLCVASDVYNKKSIIFRNGDLGLAVRASMTFPFFFKPIICDSIPLFDGGIYDNFPIKPVEEAFSPDFLIGSAVAGSKLKKIDKSLYGQIENMVMQKTDYSVDSEKGILLQFKLEDVSLLEFEKSRELYYIGYQKGEKMADSIKARVSRKVSLDELTKKRNDFKKTLPPLVFKNIIINGANDLQKTFIESQIERNKDGSFDMEKFKKAYFRLLVDSKIKEIIPRAIYNEQENCFDLYLDVTINDELTVAFGGNVSSSNANQLYLGIGYQSLTEYSLNLNLDLQVGNTYNGGVLHGRFEFPWELPVYVTGMAVYNYRKYYESEKLFLDTELSTFIHQSESYGKIGLGLPFRNKARSEINFAYGRLEDKYYQNNTHPYFMTDFDRSVYDYFKFSASIKKNTLDAKQYAIVGQQHSVIAQYISGKEEFVPADSKIGRNESHQSWLQISGKINNYHAINSKFNLGYLLETTISSKNLLNNYTTSVLQAPAFTPTPHSKLVFNESFRSNQFFAGGITPIFKLNETIHLRGDFDVFLPMYQIQRGSDNMPHYGALLKNPSYLGEASFVIRLPFMSISLYANHYSAPKNSWNFGLNIGYLIFGPKFIQ